MDTAELIHRHLPRLKARSLETDLQVTHHQLLVQCFLFGEAGRVNCFEAGEVQSALRQIVVNSLLRKIVQLIVVTLVAQH